MKTTDEHIDYLLKIVTLGESGVGKTNLISRYVFDKFNDNTMSTVGVDFSLKTLNLSGKNIKIQIWDTAGQEKLRALASAYYKNANGAILVYDITKKETFRKLIYWIKELKNNAPENAKVILLGNKSDLVAEREVAVDEGKAFAKERGYFFMEVSAKNNTDECVNKGFNILLDTILNNMNSETVISSKKGVMLRASTYEIVEKKKKKVELHKKGCC